MYKLEPIEDLVAPALIVALQGWVNAGNVGTEASDHIAADGDLVATFDPDALFDYRSNRPIVDFVDGRLLEVDWPQRGVAWGGGASPAVESRGMATPGDAGAEVRGRPGSSRCGPS